MCECGRIPFSKESSTEDAKARSQIIILIFHGGKLRTAVYSYPICRVYPVMCTDDVPNLGCVESIQLAHLLVTKFHTTCDSVI